MAKKSQSKHTESSRHPVGISPFSHINHHMTVASTSLILLLSRSKEGELVEGHRKPSDPEIAYLAGPLGGQCLYGQGPLTPELQP